MSIAAITWAVNLPLKQPLKGVLVALAYHANSEGRAWPSRTTIVRESGVTLRTVTRATKGLEALGFIEIERGSGNAVNRYSRRVGEQCHPVTVDSAPCTPSRHTSTVHGVHCDGDFRSFDGVPGAPEHIRKVKNSEGRPPKHLTLAPEDFIVSEEMVRWAETQGILRQDILFETDQFVDWHRAKGTKFEDWVAAWRKWMRNAVKFRAERAEKAMRPKERRAVL
jgi:Helix-turn-helix domain